MNQIDDTQTEASNNLKSRAESILQEKSSCLDDVSKLSVEQLQGLVHELQVHQIELELQNQKLREAHQDLSTLMDDYVDLYDMAPIGYLTISAEAIILRANLTAAKLLGIDRKLLLNKPLSNFVVPEDRDKYYLHKIHTSGKTIQNTWELRLIRGDATTFVAELRVAPILDSDGDVNQFRLLVSDITDISESARRIHQSPEILRLFIGQAPVAIAMFDNDMRYLAASNRWAADFRPEDTQLIGRLHYEVFPDVPDRFKEHHRRALSGETIRAEEDLLERADGSCKWLRWEVKPWYRPNDTVGGIIIFSEDITELKKSHVELRRAGQRQHLALQSAKAGMWEWDLLTNENIWSEELWELYGLVPHCGLPSYDLWASTIHPDDRTNAEKIVTEASSQGTELNAEWRVINPDGSVKWLMCRGASLLDEAGKPVSYLGITLDITERKLTEEEFIQHRDNLKKLVEDRTLEVKQSQELLQTIIDQLPIAVTYINMDGIFLFSNKTFQEWWVKSPDKITGHSILEVLGGDATIATELILAGLKGEEFTFELPHTFRDGVTRDLWGHVKPDKQPDGVQRGVIRIVFDITEIKKAQKDLEESEARLRAYFDAPLIGVAANSEEKGWLEANDFLCNMLGYSKQELLGMDWTQLTHPDDLPLNLEYFEKLRSGEIDVYGMEKRFIRKGGDSIWTNLSVGCVRNGDGSLKYTIAFLQDISETKRLQKAQDDIIVFLQTLLEAIPFPIMYKDIDGKYLGCNRTFESFTGLKREQIIGKSVYELYPKDLADIYFQKDQELYSHPSIQVHENLFEHHDGTRRNVVFSKSTFNDSKGNVLGMIVVMMDVTEMRQAEESLARSEKRFRDLAELLPQGIFECDSTGTFTYVNSVFSSIHSFQHNDDVMALDPLELFIPEERSRAFEDIQEIIGGRSFESREYLLQKKDGVIFPVLLSAAPIIREGDVTGFRGVVTDITPLKESERERDLLKDQLFHAQKLASLGALAGGIAHDFNNMLQVIIGYGELLIYDIEAGRATTKELKAILKTAETAADLVSKFMALGQQSMAEPKLIDLNGKIREVKDLIVSLPNIDHLNIDLVDGPTIVKQNSDQLGQIIMILASNASEAMPNGGQLSLTTTKTVLDEAFVKTHYGVKPGSYVLLTVTDTGRSIDKKILPRIFDPFFSTKQRCDIKGMGLGLSVLRGIVQQRGGFVTCESELGKGTTFRVYFPEIESPAEPDIVVAGSSLSLSDRTILIVEDNALVAGLEETAFNQAGYKTIVASGGRQAVNIYRDKYDEIGLVILDLIMPEMNGRDCLLELLKINPLVKAIVLSGHDPKSEIALEVKPRVIAFLSKPCSMSQLVEAAEVAMKS